MRITRYPSLSEQQFFGCVAAFVDSLTGELNAAAIALRRLEGQSKGSAFAYEMTLDSHRYGAMIVLDRWSALVAAFGPHLDLAQRREILATAEPRIRSAEGILARANQLIDAAAGYDSETVEAAIAGWQSLNTAFREEREAAEQFAKLGPMLSEDYTSARRIFLEDLAAR
ncbi:MAG TPA: hypothetical protein VGF59_31415 [Bryobacteraceae bacterium]